MYVYRLAVGRLDPMDRQVIPAAERIGRRRSGRRGEAELTGEWSCCVGWGIWLRAFGDCVAGAASATGEQSAPRPARGGGFYSSGWGVPVLMPVVAPVPLDADPTAVKGRTGRVRFMVLSG